MFISKIIKKYVSMMLVVAVMVTNTFSITFASESEIYGDYLLETIAETDDGEYVKLKITNTATGDVEWLESFTYADGSSYSIAQSNDEEYIIESNTEKITITFEGEVINEISLVNERDDNIIIPLAYGGWSNPVTEYSSTYIVAGNFGLIASVVASIMNLKSSSAVVGAIANYLVGVYLGEAYYTITTRYRYDWDAYKMQSEIKTTFYTDSAYRTSIDSNTRTVTTDLQTR